jgi:hypothetical protein
VDSGDERPESAGRGNGHARADLQLDENEPPPTFSQLGKSSIEAILSTSAVTLAEVDSILRDGGNFYNHHLDAMPFASRSALRIAAHFSKGLDGNADYLRDEYLTGGSGRDRDPVESGKGFDFGNHRVCAWFGKDGITLAIGTTAKNSIHRVTIPWEGSAARIDELMHGGRYVSSAVFAEAIVNERLELADKLWFSTATIWAAYQTNGKGNMEDIPLTWRLSSPFSTTMMSGRRFKGAWKLMWTLG